MTDQTRTRPGVVSSITTEPIRLATAVISGILLIISLVGPTWLHVPANTAAKMPSLELSFGDLHKLTQTVPSPGEQKAYYSWLAWLLVIATIVAALAWAVLRARVLAAVVSVLALVLLICTIFAVKGNQTWGQLGDQIKNIRVGGYLLGIAALVLLLMSLADVVRRPTPRA